MNSWHVWPKSFIVVEDSWYKPEKKMEDSLYNPPHFYEVLGGVDGLVLVQSKADHKRTLYLVNPMTRSHRRLTEVPVPSGSDLCIGGMVYDEISRSYKIFGSKWDRHKSCGDFVDSSSEDDEDDPYGTFHHTLLMYDDGKSWHRLSAPILRGLILSHLFKWQGNLMLLGGKGNSDEDCLLSVEVWQLDEERNVWMETTSMPGDLLQRFSHRHPGSGLQYYCRTGADYVYLTSCYFSACYDYQFVRHVMCKLSTTSWWEVPESEPPCIYRP